MNSLGLYEIRVQVGNYIFKIFCFFDMDDLVVVGHGFQKRTQKTPKQKMLNALKSNIMTAKNKDHTGLDQFTDEKWPSLEVLWGKNLKVAMTPLSLAFSFGLPEKKRVDPRRVDRSQPDSAAGITPLCT